MAALPGESDQNESDRLLGIIAAGVIGAAGGLVGTALMTVVLLVAEQFGVFTWGSLADFAHLSWLAGFVPAVPEPRAAWRAGRHVYFGTPRRERYRIRGEWPG